MNTTEIKIKKNETSEEHLEKQMSEVRKILKIHAEGILTPSDISMKVKVGQAYVEEVIAKGEVVMEAELQKLYGMPQKVIEIITKKEETIMDTTPIETITETATEKKARIKAEKLAIKEKAKANKKATKTTKVTTEKIPKEKRTRENALIQALKESDGAGLTLEAIGAKANEILSINRKSWTGTLGAMKRAGEITYNKETKLYNVT
jgi:hypothetical protein